MHFGADINYLAVLASGILGMIIGALWYGPVFGKVWLKATGKSPDELKRDFNPAKIYVFAFIGHIFIAYAISRLVDYVDAKTVTEGLRLAFLSWLGLTFAPITINFLFSGKSIKLLALDVCYFLVIMCLMSIIIVLWV